MKKTVAIIGGGPAAMMTAACLDKERFSVTIYEKNKTLGRKFLVAGKGGFNLTHSEDIEAFVQRYLPGSLLTAPLHNFHNQNLRDWLEQIGIPTFIGSSKRVYPEEGIKPIEVLKAILEHLDAKGVNIRTEMEWQDWGEDHSLIFTSETVARPDITVFALGGASWKITGSDGSWLDTFARKKIKTIPFEAANCAFGLDWPISFLSTHEGRPLKNISLSTYGKTQAGEVVITKFGLEGNAIYALSPFIQSELKTKGYATIFLDLKPMLTKQEIFDRLIDYKKKNTTQTLRRIIKLDATQLDLLKASLTREQYLDSASLSNFIKSLPIQITKSAPIDQAISTSGGIAVKALKPSFELKKMQNTYCIGEMIDWFAPTGGFLLQACFSMGVFAAQQINQKVKETK